MSTWFPSEPQSGCLIKLATNKKETSRRTDSASQLIPLGSTWTTLLQQCVAACMLPATCALACRVASVKDHKGNAFLTKLDLSKNKVGDAGATALAEAVKATVLMCVQWLFRARAGCCNGCRFAEWCKQLASLSCRAVCFAPFVLSCFLQGNHAWPGVLLESCSQVHVARIQNRIGLLASLARLRGAWTAAAPCEQRL